MKWKVAEQGNIALVMVMVLMSIGLILLKGLHYYQTRASYELSREEKYYQSFNLAESALTWGLTQHWVLKTDKSGSWVCQKEQNQGWVSCLKYYKNNQFILSGTGELLPNKPLTVYRWVIPMWNEGRLQARENGWIDYCPVAIKGFCQ